MTTYLVSYATATFQKAQQRLNQSAVRFDIDHCCHYDDSKIRGTDFYRRNQGILDQKKGGGYWLWKPYIILEVMRQAKEGDIIIYSDSGAEIIDSLQPLIDICLQIGGPLLFQVPCYTKTFINIQWTKRDCFILMDADTPLYHLGHQIAGSPHFYVKNQKNVAFVEEWLSYCEDPRILTDQPNTCGKRNYPEFYDHRHDQSVLSILAQRHGLEIYRDPSQFSAHQKLAPYRENGELPAGVTYSETPLTNSPYGTLFNLHREKNFSLSTKLASLIQKLPIGSGPSLPPDRGPLEISIGITTFAARFEEYFIPLLKAIRKLDEDTEIVVAINGEHEEDFNERYRQEILAFLATQKKVFPIMFPRFRGVAKLWNTIVVHATQDHILLLNDDIMITADDVFREIKRTIRENGYRSFTINQSWSHFLLSREEIDYLGYFDERFLGIGEEDGDISWRYFHEYRYEVANYRLKGIKNFAENTVYTYNPTNIKGHSGTKYSLFNRNFCQYKYEKDMHGYSGMFDERVHIVDPGQEQYPNERFYRTRKKDL